MNTNLLNIVKQIVSEQGDSILSDSNRVKAFLADLAQDVPKLQKNVFLKSLEYKFAQILKSVPETERSNVKEQLAQRLHKEEGLHISLCEDTLDLLAAALFGEGVKKMNPRINSILKDIIGQYGIEVFRDTKKFNSIISDVLPGIQNEELRLLFTATISEFDAFNQVSDELHCSALCRTIVDKLRTSGFDGDEVREVVCEIGQLIGIKKSSCNAPEKIIGKSDSIEHTNQNKYTHRYQIVKKAYDNYHGQRDEIFVSYCENDKFIANELIDYLKILKTEHNIDVWHFGNNSGMLIDEEIGYRLKKAKVVIQLVSNYYITSDYIRIIERPLIKDGIAHDNLIVRWIMVGEFIIDGTEFENIQNVTGNLFPLNDTRKFPRAKRQKEYKKIAQECIILFAKVPKHEYKPV
jgi:hypothetical protein